MTTKKAKTTTKKNKNNNKKSKNIVKVKSWAADVRFAEKLIEGDKILINQSMVEEIIISKEKFTVVLDNYVIGIL